MTALYIAFRYNDSELLLCLVLTIITLLALLYILILHNQRLRDKLRQRQEFYDSPTAPAIPIAQKFVAVLAWFVLCSVSFFVLYLLAAPYLV
jgi:uncharacterized membrane protein YhaH (DUF805 family)